MSLADLERFTRDYLLQRFQGAIQKLSVAHTNQTAAVTLLVMQFELAGSAAGIPAGDAPMWFWDTLGQDAFEDALKARFGQEKVDLQFYRTPAAKGPVKTWDFVVRVFA